MDRDKLKTIHAWSPVLLWRISDACQKIPWFCLVLMPMWWLIYLRMWHLKITKPRSYAWQEVSHIEHHRWVKRSSSCPRSLKGIINIRPSIFALQLQSTPFIFGNQLNEDYLRKLVGTNILLFDTSPLETSLGQAFVSSTEIIEDKKKLRQ